MYSYTILISLVCTCMLSVYCSYVLICNGCHLYVLYVVTCHSYVLVCHPYITRMHSYVIRMSFICSRMSSVYHSYVLVRHLYVTRMYVYVIRMSLLYGFTMNSCVFTKNAILQRIFQYGRVCLHLIYNDIYVCYKGWNILDFVSLTSKRI